MSAVFMNSRYSLLLHNNAHHVRCLLRGLLKKSPPNAERDRRIPEARLARVGISETRLNQCRCPGLSRSDQARVEAHSFGSHWTLQRRSDYFQACLAQSQRGQRRRLALLSAMQMSTMQFRDGTIKDLQLSWRSTIRRS